MSTAGKTARKALVGDEGVWIFIVADLMLFLCFFTMYSVERLNQIEAFRESQTALAPVTGAINTIVLLTSSWLVAQGVHLARAGKPAGVRIMVAFLLGALFMVVKVMEYAQTIRGGASMTDNGFFMYYFVITGMHLIHVVIGLVVLILLFNRSRNATRKDVVFMESGAAYWHMVDLLWLFIFPLLYLVV